MSELDNYAAVSAINYEYGIENDIRTVYSELDIIETLIITGKIFKCKILFLKCIYLK